MGITIENELLIRKVVFPLICLAIQAFKAHSTAYPSK